MRRVLTPGMTFAGAAPQTHRRVCLSECVNLTLVLKMGKCSTGTAIRSNCWFNRNLMHAALYSASLISLFDKKKVKVFPRLLGLRVN